MGVLLLCRFTSDRYVKKLLQLHHTLLGHGLKQEGNMPWLVEDDVFMGQGERQVHNGEAAAR